jgi:hypothetical protein
VALHSQTLLIVAVVQGAISAKHIRKAYKANKANQSAGNSASDAMSPDRKHPRWTGAKVSQVCVAQLSRLASNKTKDENGSAAAPFASARVVVSEYPPGEQWRGRPARGDNGRLPRAQQELPTLTLVD